MERFKTRLVIGWFRLSGKVKSTWELSRVGKRGTGVERALIILPNGQEDSRIATYFLKSLDPNSKTDVRILMEKSVYHSLTEPLPVTVEVYVNDDFSWLKLPKKEFVDRILSRRYHAVVDMHPFFYLPTAYLTYLSGAPLRVGFSSKYSDSFFNVQIARRSSDFLERSYLSIKRLLDL